MNWNYRQILIALFTFIGGAYFLLEFLLPADIAGFKLGAFHEEILRGIRVFGFMAVGLGLVNIIRVHGGKLLKAQTGKWNSFALLVGLFVVFTAEGFDIRSSEYSTDKAKEITNLELFVTHIYDDYREKGTPANPRLEALDASVKNFETEVRAGLGFLNTSENPDLKQQLLESLAPIKEKSDTLKSAYSTENNSSIESANTELSLALKSASAVARSVTAMNYEKTIAKQTSNFFFEGFFVPLGAAMFSLLAFYIATAAYRTFRIKSWEALIMMTAAVVVILGQIPQGELYIDENLPLIRQWVVDNISSPAFRAITFGALIAALAMSVRILFSMEKSPLAVDDDQ